MGKDLNKENFIDRHTQSTRRKFYGCSKQFKKIDHYLDGKVRSEIKNRISELDIALGAEALETIAERPIPSSLIGEIPRGSKLIDVLSALSDDIVRAIDEELQCSVVKIEALSGLKQ